MATGMAALLGLLDRAVVEPDFLAALVANPLATARAAGVQITLADVKRLLDLSEATDEEIVEVLRIHTARMMASSEEQAAAFLSRPYAGCGAVAPSPRTHDCWPYARAFRQMLMAREQRKTSTDDE